MNHHGNGWVRLPEGTNWPDPTDQREIEWTLRYGDPASVALAAAAYVHAYRALVDMPSRRRSRVIAALRAVTGQEKL